LYRPALLLLLLLRLQGDAAFLMQEVPWPKAPEVQGSHLPQVMCTV
jgi:hypothetical protein